MITPCHFLGNTNHRLGDSPPTTINSDLLGTRGNGNMHLLDILCLHAYSKNNSSSSWHQLHYRKIVHTAFHRFSKILVDNNDQNVSGLMNGYLGPCLWVTLTTYMDLCVTLSRS